MKTVRRYAALLPGLLFAAALPVFAAPAAVATEPKVTPPASMPPHAPGHLPADLLLPMKAPAPAELPNRGKVLTLIATDSYAFIEVEAAQGAQWVAGPLVPMQVGDMIGFSDGSVMQDFYSKTLNRSFPSLLFADHVAVIVAGK